MFYVLSFDPEKVMIALTYEGRVIVKKRTTKKEYRNIVLARQHLLKYQPTIISNKYGEISITVAEVFEWNQKTGILSTVFCQGKNFEGVLRESIGKNREEMVDFIKDIFEIFKSNGFLWGDFAPRNIIWNESQKIIYLVDFERNLYLKDCPIGQYLFDRYVRNYSREEFSCFLSQQEQSALFDGFLEENHRGFTQADQITSKRKLVLLKSMYGEKKCYSLDEVCKIEDIMAYVATPFKVNDVFFFPMDMLDLIGSKGGPNEYAKTVMEISKLEAFQRFSELKKIAKNF